MIPGRVAALSPTKSHQKAAAQTPAEAPGTRAAKRAQPPIGRDPAPSSAKRGGEPVAMGATPPTYPYRMKDLCELTGLPRQVIHYYIQQGLIPEGQKTGRNMAYYGPPHLARLRLIRSLQDEQFLPLKAIKAMFDEVIFGPDDDARFTAAQRRLMAEVRQGLTGVLRPRPAPPPTVDATAVLAQYGFTHKVLEDLVDGGLLVTTQDTRGQTLVSKEDVWLIALWGELRAAGFSGENGFSVRDLAIYEDAVNDLFQHEKQMLIGRLAHLPAAHIARMVERSLPLIHTFVARSHETKIRNFFSAMESVPTRSATGQEDTP